MFQSKNLCGVHRVRLQMRILQRLNFLQRPISLWLTAICLGTSVDGEVCMNSVFSSRVIWSLVLAVVVTDDERRSMGEPISYWIAATKDTDADMRRKAAFAIMQLYVR